MNTQIPCSDYVETLGVVFFARMVDKIRLKQQGLLPEGYLLGFTDPTCLDARFCRFWEVDYDDLAAKAIEVEDNEELLKYAFRNRKWPNDEQILVWNSFLIKRGWRDNGSFEEDKVAAGCAGRDDVQTYVDLHDVDEGRKPRFCELRQGV